MSACHKRHEELNLYYFADNFNMPYGNLPAERVLSLAENAFDLIKKVNPSAAVVSCNTVTALCINSLRKKYPFPVVGIQPAIKPAAARSKRCAVLATEGTAASKPISELVAKYGRGVTQVYPCKELAAYIENNIFNLDARAIEKFLPRIECDAVVLGCTHYIFLSEFISAHYGCPVYDGVDGTLDHLFKILGIGGQFCRGKGEITFMGGDVKKNFKIFNLLNT